MEISSRDLKINYSRNPIPTVEIDLNSIPDNIRGYSDLVAEGLASFAAKSPKMTATLYVYQGPSINFGRDTFSAFIGIAGANKLLEPLLKLFIRYKINARFSDYIDPLTGIAEFHIQDGYIWRPSDPATWYRNEKHDIESVKET